MKVENSETEALGLSPDRLDEGSRPEDPDRPFHVVCENVKAHFGSDLRKRFRQEVRRAHPCFNRREGMLDG